jgi:mannosyltransferase
MGSGVVARPALVAAALALLTAASLALRIGALHAGYWIDEGISVGIASHGLTDIPRTLAEDGSPPLYYLLLHVWMSVAGTSEAATRALSLLFALLAVPVAWWAGGAAFDRRTGALAAAGAAGCPFLTYYAQETRMYSLVVVLSLAASACFVLAFVRGRRRHVAWLGVWLALLLYTHTWGLFLAAAMALTWLALWRRGRVAGRDGALLGAALALVYAPWVPTLVEQALHTAAPWADRPSPLQLLAVPGGLFGYAAFPLLALAAATAVRRGPRGETAARAGETAARGGSWARGGGAWARPALDDGVRALLAIAAITAVAAWLSSQLQPAWTTRYLAVLVGPLLLALAAVLSRGARWTALALAATAATWLFSGSPPAKSNVRTVADRVAADIRPGDLVVSTQPEQVPVLYRYLPEGAIYLTPLGLVADPRMTDWRDGLSLLRAGHARRTLLPIVNGLPHGRRILLVTPVGLHSQAPWLRAVRARTREWRAALRSDPRVRELGPAHHSTPPSRRNSVRAELFEVR